MTEIPKLPAPDLESTLNALQDAIQAVNPSENDISAMIEELRQRSDLIEYIEERRNETDNWAYDWWLNDMYLTVDAPLPLNSNPGWVFPKQDWKNLQEAVKYATEFTKGIIQFKQKLENNDLPVEKVKSGEPLCNRQFYRLLNFIRIPGKEKDVHLNFHSEEIKDEEFIIVMIKSQMYKINVKSNGTWSTSQELFDALHATYQHGEKQDVPDHDLVPLLTSENRRIWAQNYAKLEVSNSENLQMIASCLFILCFDVYKEELGAFEHALTGGGPAFYGANRWFDKTLQIIICPGNGFSGLCYEHSPAEGIAVVNTLSRVLNEMGCGTFEVQNSEFDVHALKWVLDEEMRNAVLDAKKHFQITSQEYSAKITTFTSYGKSFIKSMKFSPDAYVQLALQQTYYNLNDGLCHTYESASTRRFLNGRVDNIRSATPEAYIWASTPSDNPKDKAKAFRSAMEKQTKVIKANIHGKGLDISLLGLKKASEKLNNKFVIPCIFKSSSKIYADLNYFKLSTSQIPISLSTACNDLKDVSYMGYGPVVPDGYGAAYNIREDNITIVATSNAKCEKTDSEAFVKEFERVLCEMKEVLLLNEKH